MKINRRKFIMGLGISIVTLSVLTYSWYDRIFTDITEINLNLGYNVRIMHITDAHLHEWSFIENDLAKLISEVSQDVDLTVLTGDIYDSWTPYLEIIDNLFSSTNSPAIAVLGNHEHWASDKYPIYDGIDRYKSFGIKVLINESISYRGTRIGGIDWYSDVDEIALDYLLKIGDVDILLSHTPDVIGVNPKAKIIFAGHTHGGQINIPVIGPLWIPSKYGSKYASGLFKHGETFMYVSRGVGEAYFLPLRLNCNRELVIYNL